MAPTLKLPWMFVRPSLNIYFWSMILFTERATWTQMHGSRIFSVTFKASWSQAHSELLKYIYPSFYRARGFSMGESCKVFFSSINLYIANRHNCSVSISCLKSATRKWKSDLQQLFVVKAKYLFLEWISKMPLLEGVYAWYNCDLSFWLVVT